MLIYIRITIYSIYKAIQNEQEKDKFNETPGKIQSPSPSAPKMMNNQRHQEVELNYYSEVPLHSEIQLA